ncbi:MAG: dihydroxy-acid dehydratase, partial [Treponemataceae bacterium]|nr:dihydroxy-acid dehydratase [Treponemataceae bacterium]
MITEFFDLCKSFFIFLFNALTRNLLAKNLRPLDIMTPAAFKNAETVDMAIGASTN